VDERELSELNTQFEAVHPEVVLAWTWETFGPSAVVTSSFQTQSVPLLHMMANRTPDMPVLFLDTGFHFPETLRYRDQIVTLLGLHVEVIGSEYDHDQFRRRHGELYRENPDLCCYTNKIEPLQQALAGKQAWVSGIRHDQTLTRRDSKIVSRHAPERLKICPMLKWTRDDVQDYIHQYKLPRHPLTAKGYSSIGCFPCTRPVHDLGDERAGRWSDSQKTECGLHLGSAWGERKGND